MYLTALAFTEQPVGNPTVMDDRNGLSILDHLLDWRALRAAGMQADKLHLRSPLPQFPEDAAHFFRAAELVGIDALLFARPKEFDNSPGCEIFLHVPIHNGAHVGVSADGIRADDQSGNAVFAKMYRW
jgi:hypothetical protein